MKRYGYLCNHKRKKKPCNQCHIDMITLKPKERGHKGQQSPANTLFRAATHV